LTLLWEAGREFREPLGDLGEFIRKKSYLEQLDISIFGVPVNMEVCEDET
jgi:hypothetical protein